MATKRKITLFMLLLFALSTFYGMSVGVNVPSVAASPGSFVGTTYSGSAVSYPYSPKLFKTTYGYLLFTWEEGTIYYYLSYNDGQTWIKTSVRACPSYEHFAAYATGTTVYLVVVTSTGAGADLVYRKGTIGYNTITWTVTDEKIYDGAYFPGVIAEYLSYPAITVASNGVPYAVVSDSEIYSNMKLIMVFIGNSDGTFSQKSGADVTLSEYNVGPATALKLDSGVFFVYSFGDAIYGRNYNGTLGSEETLVSYYTSKTFSASASGNTVFLAFYASNQLKVLKRVSQGNYVTYNNLYQTANTLYPVISVCSSTEPFVTFALGTSIYLIRFNVYHDSWEDVETLVSSVTLPYNHAIAAVRNFEEKLAVIYISAATSPRIIYFETENYAYYTFSSVGTKYGSCNYFDLPIYIHVWDVDKITYVKLTLSYYVTLKYTYPNVFTEEADPNSYCSLNASGSSYTKLTTSTAKVTFRIMWNWSCPDGTISALSVVVGTSKFTDTLTVNEDAFVFNSSLIYNLAPTVYYTNESATVSWSYYTTYTASSVQIQFGTSQTFNTVFFDTNKTTLTSNNQIQIMVPTSVADYLGKKYLRIRTWNTLDYASKWHVYEIEIYHSLRVYGPYYENGTLYSGNVTASITYTDKETVQNLTLTPPLTILNLTKQLESITVDFSSGVFREIYFYTLTKDVYMLCPSNEPYLYTIKIQDHAGLIGADKYLEVKTFVPGMGLVTAVCIPARSTMAMVLEFGRTYRFSLVTTSGTVYDFGSMTVTYVTEIPFSTIPSFPDWYQSAYKNVQIYADSVDGYARVFYVDNLNNTENCIIRIIDAYGNVLFSEERYTSVWQIVYPLPANSSVTVTVEVQHGTYGKLSYTKHLLQPTTLQPLDLSFLGNWGAIDATQILPILMVVVFACLFGVLDVRSGAVLTILFAGFLYLLGWLRVELSLLTVALSLALLYAIGKRRIEE